MKTLNVECPTFYRLMKFDDVNDKKLKFEKMFWQYTTLYQITSTDLEHFQLPLNVEIERQEETFLSPVSKYLFSC